MWCNSKVTNYSKMYHSKVLCLPNNSYGLLSANDGFVLRFLLSYNDYLFLKLQNTSSSVYKNQKINLSQLILY